MLWLVPARLAVMWLGFAFDVLPHHGLHHTPQEDRFGEPVLTTPAGRELTAAERERLRELAAH